MPLGDARGRELLTPIPLRPILVLRWTGGTRPTDWLEWFDLEGYSSSMKKASITEAKNKLSSLIDGLKAGSPVLIVDRGRPVARLEAVTGAETEDGGRLSRLIREGIVRPGRTPLSRSWFAAQPPRPERGASAVAALIEERRESR
jgi:antitoxin (DNA-binding transcriptional repressor) of toxin-antitoxin stability system